MSRIAIDYTPAYEQGGGIGRYVRELTAALATEDPVTDYRLFVAGAKREQLPHPPGPNFDWRTTILTPRWLARIWQRAQLPLPVEIITGPVDLFHATDFVLPPTLPRTRSLLTVHDLSFLRVPDAASPSLRRYLEAVAPRSVERADHVLADSQATKDDLIEIYRTPADKISVLYSGVDARFGPVTDQMTLKAVLDKHNLRDKKYVLSVGTVQPRKNYSGAIRALSRIRDHGIDLHYVVAGGPGWLEDEMYRSIRETAMEDRVHILGFVPDEDLPALYSGARALLALSLYEGFGLPVLEAMACGTPVITSNLSSLPEVAGDAGILVNPLDSEAISDAIMKTLTDAALRQQLVAAGFERVKRFSWASAASQLKAIYDAMLDGSSNTIIR
ncbi:MAG: glycosyltransferase family 1 protein [Chloroflexota bacterium]|nr:glycosyltransferase family 1 protein [Chloroflexota bacterium]